MDERHVFREARRRAERIHAMDRQQLRRPMLETGGVEDPASGVRKPLRLRQVELGLLALLNIEVDTHETEQRSIACAERLNATQEPAVHAARVPHPKGCLTRTCSENRFADLSRRLMVVWMEQLEMGVPGDARLHAEAQRMVARETQVVRIPVIDERERSRRQRVPGERRNRIEGGLQLCRERLIHMVCPRRLSRI